MHTLSVSVDSIEIGERHRPLDDGGCKRLMVSMTEIGLRQPITVRIGEDGTTTLVTGRHRLEAARRLNWSHIDCIEIADDPIAAELWEIAENLHRHDLSKDQRDEHIRRYCALLKERREREEGQGAQNEHPVLSDGRRAGPQHEKGIALQIAEETGLSRSTVKRALANQPRPHRPNRSAVGQQIEALKRAWRNAGPEARRMFLDSIQQREAA